MKMLKMLCYDREEAKFEAGCTEDELNELYGRNCTKFYFIDQIDERGNTESIGGLVGLYDEVTHEFEVWTPGVRREYKNLTFEKMIELLMDEWKEQMI